MQIEIDKEYKLTGDLKTTCCICILKKDDVIKIIELKNKRNKRYLIYNKRTGYHIVKKNDLVKAIEIIE